MNLNHKKAMVTGASQGIGKAIAKALAALGVEVYMVGRSIDRLRAAAREFESSTLPPVFLEADLSSIPDISAIVEQFSATGDTLDILVNCGGIYFQDSWAKASADEFRQILETNVLGPYSLTQSLLPYLARARGDVVFINSSIVKGSGADAGQYAAAHHALQSLADSLRAEVNDRGIRVMSVYPGRTATPRQQAIYKAGGRDYQPERLLQPEDVAATVVNCLCLAATAEVTDLHIRQRHKA